MGPGSLASPGRRLGARLLDALVLLPVFLVLLGITLAIAAPHFGAMFPTTLRTRARPVPTPGLVWLYLTVLGVGLLTGLVLIAHETVTTVKWGRTLGKRWVGIRPIRSDGSALTWGRSFGRITRLLAVGHPVVDRPARPALVPVGREQPVPARQDHRHDRDQ